jgi:hypothetical protein
VPLKTRPKRSERRRSRVWTLNDRELLVNCSKTETGRSTPPRVRGGSGSAPKITERSDYADGVTHARLGGVTDDVSLRRGAARVLASRMAWGNAPPREK